MANSVNLISNCFDNQGTCEQDEAEIDGVLSTEIKSGVDANGIPYFSPTGVSLGANLHTIEYFVGDASVANVRLTILHQSGSSPTFEPSSGVTPAQAGSSTTIYEFDVPGNRDPYFCWEIPDGTPGIALRVVVKRK
ncbi:MAG: hypothetical protein AAF799_24785 [Myxococcota bacterium]